VAELVQWYDENFTRGLDRVRSLTPQQLATPIDFLGVFNYPAVFYLAFLNNHSIHHRGELATYLRPMGSKVPSIYGGSYDEPFQMPEAQTSAA
ncbi:MAG TPA: DinB family protein, partial [Terriglobales bacterium]|nr:DinB family protein [Terriglobales bacterium]